jgi:multicomponent Na+:H+ antiporter subunit C
VIVVLAVVVGCFFAGGTFLLLQRTLTRTVLAIGLFGNGVNVLLLSSGGRAGSAPILGGEQGPLSDPMPQSMALTAIVITFGIMAFLLALAYRSWTLTGLDEAEDDLEDRRVAAQELVEEPDDGRGRGDDDEELP